MVHAERGFNRPFHMRIGINTGVLSVGSFGSEGRMSYTAIGLQANIAGRIQAQCEPGAILISENTWHLLKDRIPCQTRGSLQLRGVHFPIDVHEPLYSAEASTVVDLTASRRSRPDKG